MTDDDVLDAVLSGVLEKLRDCVRERGPDALIEDRPLIHWAVSADEIKTTKELLALGADPNGRTSSGETALMAAAYLGNFQLVSELVKADADVSAYDDDGQNALMAAAKAGRIDVLRLLIKSGADLNHVDFRGRSALHWALTEADNDETVRLLLECGAPKNLVSADGLSARDYAGVLKRKKAEALL